ncbi:hypothetical protein B0T24DRAFT_410703 [Lasiosphaeria ovina]|uniref:Nicotinamide N-methyltransferase n=1 Tax=Lasiosphaeria ovina TaxID=92902 RepID=A0AAE0JXR6_9PEZI|nr:hypothetical protein B0T24DRAFT_410703 [Lasiosphaeria ovina]
MALVARLTTNVPETEPEDIMASALGVIFPDDITNQHGDPSHGLIYTSPHLPKPLHIKLADPTADEDRSLFGHYLWNSSLLLAELVEAGTLKLDAASAPHTAALAAPAQHSDKPVRTAPLSDFNVAGLSTIELGAGTALPSLMATLLGARRVVVTDYPAPVNMEVLRHNVAANTQPSLSPSGQIAALDLSSGGGGIEVEGHGWGELDDTPLARENRHAFDRVFVADCLWMPWQHDNLRQSVAWFLGDGPDARALIVAGFHTGREKMRGFFDAEALAAQGLEVESIWERDCDSIDREWVLDRGLEDPGVRKRWLAVAVLRRALRGNEDQTR